jgi:hypothetical protein
LVGSIHSHAKLARIVTKPLLEELCEAALVAYGQLSRNAQVGFDNMPIEKADQILQFGTPAELEEVGLIARKYSGVTSEAADGIFSLVRNGFGDVADDIANIGFDANKAFRLMGRLENASYPSYERMALYLQNGGAGILSKYTDETVDGATDLISLNDQLVDQFDDLGDLFNLQDKRALQAASNSGTKFLTGSYELSEMNARVIQFWPEVYRNPITNARKYAEAIGSEAARQRLLDEGFEVLFMQGREFAGTKGGPDIIARRWDQATNQYIYRIVEVKGTTSAQPLYGNALATSQYGYELSYPWLANDTERYLPFVREVSSGAAEIIDDIIFGSDYQRTVINAGYDKNGLKALSYGTDLANFFSEVQPTDIIKISLLP